MLRTSITSVLGLVLLAGTSRGDDKQLTDAGRQTAELSGYSFTIEEGNAGDKQPRQQVAGKYEKGQPVFFLADKIEFYKKGDVLVYKDGDNWQKSRTGTLSDPLRILGGAAKVRSARLPHEELAALVKALKDVKEEASKAGGSTTFAGTLDETAAKKMAPTSLASVAREGKATLALDKNGKLFKYSFTIRVQGTLGNAEIDGQVTRWVTLSDLDTARVKLPEGAKKALE